MRYTTPRLWWEARAHSPRLCCHQRKGQADDLTFGGRRRLHREQASSSASGAHRPLEPRSEAGSPSVSPTWPRDRRFILQKGQFQYGRRPQCSHNRRARGAPLGLCRSEPRQGTDLAGASPAFLTALSRSFSKCTDFLPEAPTETGGSMGHVSAWLCPLQGGPAVQKHLEASLNSRV